MKNEIAAKKLVELGHITRLEVLNELVDFLKSECCTGENCKR
ncbi:hypothetical protein [Desulfobacula sp.]|nr:hypothetical protein [Desulfobacula sp.]